MTTAKGTFPARQKWDAAALLGVGVLLLVLRLPLAVEAIGASSIAVLLMQGITYRRGFGLLMIFFAVACLLSGLATVLHPSALTSGYFAMAICYLLLALATCFSGDVSRNIRVIFGAVYTGLWVHFVISMGELLSGIKILPLRNPLSGAAPVVADDPFIVTSLFVNYNDYSVAMVIFINFLFAKLMFTTRQARWQAFARSIAMCAAAGLVILIGSRGALVALVVTTAIQMLMVTRFAHPKLVTKRMLWAVIVFGATLLMVMWNSPYFQTHSTQWREQILSDIWTLMRANPTTLIVGFGSAALFAAIGKAAYPGMLLNPHNLLMEMVIAYGIPTVIVFGICLLTIFARGLMRQQVPMNSLGVIAITTALGLVVYGTVPSGYLDYGYPFIFLITGLAAISLKGGSGAQPAPPDSSKQEGGCDAERESSAADKRDPNYHRFR